MKSFIHKSGPATPSMNLTPLIDIVFLLVVFFMLASTMVTRQAIEMTVPKLDNPETHDLSEENRIVVNIAPKSGKRDKNSPLEFEGKPAFVQIGAYGIFKLDDHEGITAALKDVYTKNPSIKVSLRADAAVYYDHIEPIMSDITKAGISTVNMVAYLPTDAGKP
ncbi:biopolymer transporter ExbD [Planctomycetota bacterium]|nr:biopolymer transporter ExbD [Planctomycetota bacterium]